MVSRAPRSVHPRRIASPYLLSGLLTCEPIIKGTCPVCSTGLNIIGKTMAEMS